MGLAHSPSIITQNLVLCLDAANPKSYPGSGTTWTDLSGNGNNGTLKGTTTFNQNTIDLGDIGNTTNYILLPNSLMTNIADFTLSLWLNPFNITSGNLNCIFHATNAGGNDFSIEWYNNRIQTLINATYSTFNYTFTNNTWYNFVFYRTGGTTMGLYINGVSQGTQSCPSTTFNITGAIVMGQEQDAIEGGFQAVQSYVGKYGVVSYYNRALTAAEIQQNFNALKGRFFV
jgi:hypothetical protein